MPSRSNRSEAVAKVATTVVSKIIIANNKVSKMMLASMKR